mmetsp:Transcript_21025/g.37246  ORF Transcript_21025/g.37246 Transcript_21025/m.37246 type:complete len:404 (+) Transcript_21025:97-1308(+)
MADMNAMFAARKKKGKKSKNTNFNQILDNADLIEQEMQTVEKYDDDGNVISTAEIALNKAVTSGSLTATVEANKKKNQKVISAKGNAADFVEGEWVDEKAEETPAATMPSSKRAVIDLDGLSSSKPDDLRAPEVQEKEELNKKMFHWTRKQAIQENVRVKPKEMEAPKSLKYRPREMLVNKEGKEALKELSNDKVFPSLGGAGTSSQSVSSSSAWGVIRQEVIEEFEVKQVDGEYLGSEFIESEEFDGQKLGYSFKLGHKGQGYYWEGPQQKSDNSKSTGDEAQTDEAPTEEATQAPEQPAAASAPAPAVPEPTAEELALQKEQEEEKERKRKAKKAEKDRLKAEWEREQALAIEREERERKEKEEAAKKAAEAATAAAAGGAEPPADRFAGLKKKKKKKPVA